MIMPQEYVASKKRNLKRKKTNLYKDATPEQMKAINEKSKEVAGLGNLTYKQVYGED
ncbi:hypothetical protein [Oceanobacillus locisalsi]|uniref:Uncharacterized protein n=1 Tax=Oceanobacillus locisalsi TaxID=546107 RepID=A0ABW3NN05_9BACI